MLTLRKYLHAWVLRIKVTLGNIKAQGSYHLSENKMPIVLLSTKYLNYINGIVIIKYIVNSIFLYCTAPNNQYTNASSAGCLQVYHAILYLHCLLYRAKLPIITVYNYSFLFLFFGFSSLLSV